MEVRRALESDFDRIYDLVCELEGQKMDYDSYKGAYKMNINSLGVQYLVIESEGLILGFGSLHIQHLLHHVGKVAEIQELIISTHYQSQGLGAKLINAFREIAMQKRCVLLEVSCSLDREDAHRFYEKNYFEKTHYKFTMDLK